MGLQRFFYLSKLTNYLIGVPLVVIISLTDTIYANGSNLYARMSWIFCLSPINMCTRILILGVFFIFCLQWENAAKNISERANQDELEAVGNDYVRIEGSADDEDEDSTNIEFMRI